MDLGHCNNNFVYASLITSEELCSLLVKKDVDGQLQCCQDIFEANNLVEHHSHEIVYTAWDWIVRHRLFDHVGKNEQQYLEELNDRYRIRDIVDSEKRKQKAREKIQNIWSSDLESCLGSLCPLTLGRNLLEQLAVLAQLCDDIPSAIRLLEVQITERTTRSRSTKHIIAKDVERAIQALRSQQTQADATEGRQIRSAGGRQSGAVQNRQTITAKGKYTGGKRTGAARHSHKNKSKRGVYQNSDDPRDQERPDQSSQLAETWSEASSDLSSMFTADLQSSSDEPDVEDDSYSHLQSFFPVHITDVVGQFRKELDQLSQRAPPRSWGEISSRRMSQILMKAKPCTVFIKGVRPGIRVGPHTTSSREEADVLSLDDEDAAAALADGPHDGKRVLIRRSKDRRDLTADQFMTYLQRYKQSNIEVQDPTNSVTRDSFREMSPDKIIRDLRQIFEGIAAVGYGGDQIPPYNLLSLPSLFSREPLCLSKIDATRIHHLLRTMNQKPGLPAPEPEFWSTLAEHLALTLAHQDHDGHGTLVYCLFGYNIWIFWPSLTEAGRSRFLKKGIRFSERGARYLVLGPQDVFVQTPCRSQDVHAVGNFGYCGVSTCLEQCVKNKYPRCCGLIGKEGMHYWHGHFMYDSVKSATDELESGLATNQDRNADFLDNLERLSDLGKQDNSLLGGPEACQRFEEAKMVNKASGSQILAFKPSETEGERLSAIAPGGPYWQIGPTTCLALRVDPFCIHHPACQLFKRSDEEFIEHVVTRSSSIVFLPPLPKQAEKALHAHNEETLAIFRTYVKTYADQHLHEPDDKLPFTQLQIGSDETFSMSANMLLPSTVVRSPFVALSGHGDEFDTVSDLCSTVRSGVFLEEAVVPYLPIYQEESDTPLNAYLYDFYKHGDVKALEQANKIRSSDVWFYLNDFSLVLATIITSLSNFMKLSPNSDADMIDLMGSGDAYEEQQDDKAIDKQSAQKSGRGDEKDQESSKLMEAGHENGQDNRELLKVLKAFKIVQEEFNKKFRKMWA